MLIVGFDKDPVPVSLLINEGVIDGEEEDNLEGPILLLPNKGSIGAGSEEDGNLKTTILGRPLEGRSTIRNDTLQT